MSELPDPDALLDLVEEGLMVLKVGPTVRPPPQILRVNRRLAELTGFARAVLEGRSLRILRGAAVSREQFARVLEAIARRERTVIPMLLRSAQNGDLPVRLRLYPLPSRDDIVVAWVDHDSSGGEVGTDDDVLGAARTLASLTDECFYVLAVADDLRLTLRWIDERADEIFGVSAGELITQGGFAANIAERDRRAWRAHNHRLVAGEPSAVSYRIRTRAGALRWVRDRGRQLRLLDGGLVAEIVGSLAVRSEDLPRAGALPRAERMAAALANQLHALVCLVNDRGEITWASAEPATRLADAVRGTLGFDPNVAPEDRLLDRWLDLVDTAFAASEPTSAALGWPANEAPLPVEVNVTPIEENLALAVFRPAGDALQGDQPSSVPGTAPFDILDILEGLAAPALLLTPMGEIVRLNDAARRLGRAGRQRLRAGARLADLLPDEAGSELVAALRQLGQQAGRAELTIERAGAAGGPRQLRLLPLPLGPNGRPAVLAAILDDRATIAVGGPRALADARLEALVQTSHDAVFLFTPDGRVLAASLSAEHLFGRPRGELIASSIDELLRGVGSNGPGVLPLLAAETIGVANRLELLALRPGEEAVTVEVAAYRIELGETVEILASVRDLSARRATEDTVRFLAYYDMLTGLPNRRLFEDRLTQCIEQARQSKHGFAVLLLDLDRFRLINDSLGLAKGDNVLSAVAGRLSGLAAETDTVARFGADEFMILATGCSGPEAAAKVAQRLLDGLKAPLTVGEHELTIASSIGVALFPEDGQEPDGLVKNAIAALARAKEHGRNRFQFYTDDMNASAFQRLMLETRLRRALDQGELVLYYQPQCLAADGRVIGAEALLRWFHPEIGLVPPADFIPLAEETGLIVPIGAWVLEVACRQAQRWQRELGRPDFRVSVNLSARQFEHKDLVPTIADVLQRTGLPPATLDLEITESVVMREADDAVRRLNELTALGVTLAIDDFGTGYSSLAYLRRFPIGSLKIDRSFTTDIERDQGSATIARAIVALGQSLNLKIVAEGVETQGQLDMLHGFGCDEVQGYYLCRPLPAEEVAQAIAAGRLPIRPA